VAGRVLLTGATGFVGSHLARAFVEAGYRVLCSARATSDLSALDGLPVELVTLDLAHAGEIPVRLVRDVEIVVHAAGSTRARRAGDYLAVNAQATRQLAEAAAAADVRRFVLISSLAARGPDASSHDGRDRPASAYGRSKAAAEDYLRGFGDRMETVALRLAAVYGPRDTDFLPLIKLARSGWLVIPNDRLRLQPVYAEDVARAVLAAARAPAYAQVGFGPFPVAERGTYTWPEVAQGLGLALGRTVRTLRLPAAVPVLAGRLAQQAGRLPGVVPVLDERRARDLAVNAWTCDVTDTEEKLGWQAEVPLFDGLKRTVNWYRRAGWLL
jgi:nucleoside-diphosphate-sugar epimerase